MKKLFSIVLVVFFLTGCFNADISQGNNSSQISEDSRASDSSDTSVDAGRKASFVSEDTSCADNSKISSVSEDVSSADNSVEDERAAQSDEPTISSSTNTPSDAQDFPIIQSLSLVPKNNDDEIFDLTELFSQSQFKGIDVQVGYYDSARALIYIDNKLFIVNVTDMKIEREAHISGINQLASIEKIGDYYWLWNHIPSSNPEYFILSEELEIVNQVTFPDGIYTSDSGFSPDGENFIAFDYDNHDIVHYDKELNVLNKIVIESAEGYHIGNPKFIDNSHIRLRKNSL